eukprot:2835509-Rhodomonas_salina.1
MVTQVLRQCQGFTVSFVDDILIYLKTLEEHIQHVSKVLLLLASHGLRTKQSKCQFFTRETTFLGHVISADGISVDPAKTTGKSITEWQEPSDQHDLRSFLGLANYYSRFIDRYADICVPLFPLLGKDAPWVWSDACRAAFLQLKDALSHAPTLANYNPDAAKTVLVTDASNFALGGVLMQGGGDNDLRPVAFYSRKFSSAERNYTTREQELLAIKECLRTWRHYTYSTRTAVRTDHDSLRWIFMQKNLT